MYSHILLGLQIILGCWGVFYGIYGLRETSKPVRESFFTSYQEAAMYKLLSVSAIVFGGLLAFASMCLLVL